MEKLEKNVIKSIAKNLKDLSNDITRVTTGMNNIGICKSLNDNANVLESLISENEKIKDINIDDEQLKATNMVRNHYRKIDQQSRTEDV